MKQPPAPSHYRFGAFEVDVVTGELRRSGIRLRLAGQPFRILMALLARPGELVTREELRDEVWSQSTFVDFEHGLNAAVNKLRRALGDAAENPQYIETHPGRGYRFIGTVDRPQAPPVVAVEVPTTVEVSARRRILRWPWLAGAAVSAILAASAWRIFVTPSATPAPWQVKRLTADPGLSNSGALSRDGKLVVYSSDRANDGQMDLYVMQVAGGQPVRLTSDGANNTTPDFSPDASRIIFHSSRDGGGIYEMGAFGGEARLLVAHGLNPKYSPDGSEVAYWLGEPNVASSVPGGGEVWVVAAGGGEPRRIGAQFTNARYPIWAPDGQHLLLTGYTEKKSADSTAVDWWVVSTHGDAAVRTDAHQALARASVQTPVAPLSPSTTFPQVPTAGCWLAATNSIVFPARTGDTQSLWEADLSPRTFKVTGTFRRVTAGAGDEIQPSCAASNAVVFTSGEHRQTLWSVKGNLDGGSFRSAPVGLTSGTTDREPSLSADGHYMAYSSAQSGALNIWMREWATGRETHIEPSAQGQRYALIDATGSRIAYSAFEKGDKRAIYLWSRNAAPEKLCENCLQPTGWTPDEKKLLVFGGSPFHVDLLDLATHRQTPLVSHKTYNVVFASFSPDGLWIAFTVREKPNRSLIAIAPVNGSNPIPESAWIKISREGPEDKSRWSPDGRSLYFASARDGHKCLWGQRLDATSRKPVGEPFAVQHFHGRTSYDDGGWSYANGRIVFGLIDNRGNVWMMTRAGSEK